MAHVNVEKDETKVILTLNEREAALLAMLTGQTAGGVAEADELYHALGDYHEMADDLFTYNVNQWNHIVTSKS